MTSFPIVPGLGNLLLNLAFNQSSFLVAALFDSLGPHLWGYSLLGGVLPWLGLTLSGFALLQGLCALLELRRPLEPIEKAYLISLPAFPEIRSVELNASENPLGIHLYYPKAGDQVFDAPLPAARESRPTLRILDKTKGISDGFRDSRIDDWGRQIEEGDH